MHGGIADSVKIESEDNGFHLVVESDEGTFIFNVHGIAPQLLQEVQRTIGEWWWAEGQAVRGLPASAVFRCAPEDIDESGGLAQAFGFDSQEELDAFTRDAYDRSDPKHPAWHSTHADIWDSREGK